MRIAIVGMGSIGRRHAANVKALGHEVIAYDSNIQVQEATKADYAKCVTLQGLWDCKPEVVLICTPPGSHLELATEAIAHGCYVFIEKPLGLSLDGWVEIAEECQQRHLVNLVGCNWRWHLAFEAVTRWVDKRMVKRPATMHVIMAYDLRSRADYQFSYAATLGATLDVAWHLVDLANWIFGTGELEQAKIWPASQIGLSCDGTAEIHLRHQNGNLSRLLGDFASGIDERSLSIMGADGEPDIKMLLCPTNDMYLAELRHFLDCVREGKPTCNPIGEGIKTLDILLKAKGMGCQK